MNTLSIGSLARNTFTFCCTKCFFLVLVVGPRTTIGLEALPDAIMTVAPRSGFLADPPLLVPAPIRGRKTPGRPFAADYTGRFCSEVNTRLVKCVGDPYTLLPQVQSNSSWSVMTAQKQQECVLHLTSLLYASCGLWMGRWEDTWILPKTQHTIHFSIIKQLFIIYEIWHTV